MIAQAVDLVALAREVQSAAGLARPPRLVFLARGEYSVNYLTLDTPEPWVVRCITGSQMGLPLDAQVRYEEQALRLLAPSGRAPLPIAVRPRPEAVPFPFLVESYLPGRPLDYATDLDAAATCVAALHRVAIPLDHGLYEQRDPCASIVAEAREWAAVYLEWSAGPAASRAALRRAFDVVEAGVAAPATPFSDADLAIVNYDLNSHNFIVRPDDGFVSLVDWEKARVAPAVQDLAHFLLPTTTLWRAATATRLTPEQEERFLAVYLAERPSIDPQRLTAQLAWMKRLIALRAVSWCAWAVWATAVGARAIANAETLERSRAYLQPAFLEALFA